MPITLNHSNISVQYSTGSNYIIETVKSDLYVRNENVDTVIRNNIQTAPVTPATYVDSSGYVYAVESYTYSGTANTADYTRVFTKNTTCDILVVGGGGGGGTAHAGGGGAGSLIYLSNVLLNAGTYNIKVGKGGTGATARDGVTGGGPNNGSDSSIIYNAANIYLAKGGGGGRSATGQGASGGSGGGGDGAFTGGSALTTNIPSGSYGNSGGSGLSAAQGSPDYWSGGGGGGADSSGTSSSLNSGVITAGNGGNGKLINITGANTYYAAGGGGGCVHANNNVAGLGGLGNGGNGGSNSAGLNASNNTGSGGGGGGFIFNSNYSGGTDYNGGNGGSGIIIIRYLLGSIPVNNFLTAEPTVIFPTTFTERVQSFKHSGGAEEQTTYTIYFPTDTQCDMLIIGGGGSGSAAHGGGGGAGAVIFMKNVTMNGNYTIKVGKGGICETPVSINAKGRKGNDTEIFKTNNTNNKIVAEGGGGGGQLANANGGSGGSGGGGDAYNIAAGTGGVANAYTPILDGVTGIKYGNNGGNAFGNPGHGGGGGGAGGVGENALAGYNSGNNENERAHGGVGIKSATINSVNYDFKTLFGTNVGGVVETDGFLYFGGGGGNGRWAATSGAGSEGGNGGLGGGGKGGWGTAVTSTQPLGGAGFPGVNGTGGGGGGGGDNVPLGGDGGSGIVIIKYNKRIFITEGNPISHRSFDLVVYDLTKNVEYLAQQKTGVGGWRIVRYLPPTSTLWYQGNYINTSTFNIPTIGTPYNYTNEWAVPFGTFDEMVFGTFNMNYWLRCLKTSVLGTYNNVARPIISSSFSTTPYNANWYNRAVEPEDPWISIQNYPTQVVYGENQTNGNLNLISIDGGMCVLVRDSTTNTTIPNPNTYTLNFPVPTTTDIIERTSDRGILNNSNLILQGTYDINLTASSATIVPRTGQYLPFTATSNLSQNIGFRYHLLNPIKMPEGAQWTYNSSNANVYHLGNVGIGTTNPSYNLDVRGTIFTSTGGYTQSGLTTWTVMSDKRIKENIVKASYEKCLENVKNIELYNFNFKDNYVNTNDRRQLGFIAQEVQQVYPKAVEVGKMIMKNNDGIENILSLNTTQIEYTLYGAVKKLIDNIEEMENEIAEIENTSNITIQA